MTNSSTPKWTIETLQVYTEAMQKSDERFQQERDRRYSEVNIEREKALKIKETADLAALQLAREIQTYKDEKANQLREQINSERGSFASKGDLNSAVREIDAKLAPLLTSVTGSEQRGKAYSQGFNWIGVLVGIISGIAVAFGALFLRGGSP